MSAKTAITADDLIHIPRPENGKHYELSQGELIVVGNAGATHEWIKGVLHSLLAVYLHSRHMGRVFAETQFATDFGARIPGLAFVGAAKLALWPRESIAIPFAPDIAIEIISDSETAAYSETKAAEYLASGVAEVWQIYPRQGTVRVRMTSAIRDLNGAETLESPLLPGFSIGVAAIFEGA